MAPRSTQRQVIAAIEQLRDDQGVTRRALAARLGRTHQWLDSIVAGRTRITLDDAAVLIASLGARLEVASARPDTALYTALAADADLTPEWRDAVWALYARGKERALRTRRTVPARRAVDRFVGGAGVPRGKRPRAAASSE